MLVRWLWQAMHKPQSPLSIFFSTYYHFAPLSVSRQIPSSDSFFLQELQELMPILKASTQTEIGDGSETHFWTDRWHPQGILALSTNKESSVREVIQSGWDLRPMLLSSSLSLATQAAHSQAIICSTSLSTSPDVLTWSWNSNGKYSSKSCYNLFFKTNLKAQWNSKIWKLKIPNKVRIFLWLTSVNRLPTQENLSRKRWTIIHACKLCTNGTMESADHLFIHCPYAKNVWNLFGVIPPANGTSTLPFWERTRHSLNDELVRRKWDLIWSATCWTIWKQRNQRIFTNKRAPPSISYMLASKEAEIWADNF
ncbi:hypothetical protein LUZ60_006515 [Juncus effusus]|nr:hypothetical protein LUZ60_006515 [Juncus effusus]